MSRKPARIARTAKPPEHSPTTCPEARACHGQVVTHLDTAARANLKIELVTISAAIGIFGALGSRCINVSHSD